MASSSLRRSVGPAVLVVLGLLWPAAVVHGEPEPGLVTVLSGRVEGLAEGVAARVEIRRLDEAVGYLWPHDSPRESGLGIARMSERWLTRGLGGGPPVAERSVTGEATQYHFDVPGSGPYELRLVRSGAPIVTRIAVVRADGQHVRCDLVLSPGPLDLRVRLRMTDGSPFRGVVVAEQDERGWYACPYLHGAQEVVADETGLVVFEGLHAGACELSALVPGTLRVHRPPVMLPIEGELAWTVDPGRSVEGRVVRREDGTPVCGATLYASGRRVGRIGAMARTQSDATGRFRSLVGDPGTELLIVADGRAPARVRVRDGTDLGTVRLALSTTVIGWVTRPDGGPAGGATVHVEPQGALRHHLPTIQTRADARGRYTFRDVPPGEARVFVRDAAWISPDIQEDWTSEFDALAVDLLPGEPRRRDLAVVAARRMRGRVLDADGKPVVGALVRGEFLWDHLRYSATDAAGTFVTGGLLEGCTFDLDVKARGLSNADLRDVPVRAGSEPLTIRLERSSFLPVTVVAKASGAPVVRAQVTATRMVETERGHRTSVQAPQVWTDATGRARVGPMRAGAWHVEVTAPGFAVGERDVVVGPSATLRVSLEPPVEPSGPCIRGHVIAPPRVALADLDLRLSEPDEVLLGRWRNNGGIRVVVDEEGCFEAKALEPGRYGLRATLRGEDGWDFFGEVTAVAGEERVEVYLQPAPWGRRVERAWIFRILDENGQPAEGGFATGRVREAERSRSVRREYRGGRLVIPSASGALDAGWVFRDAVDACGLWLPFAPACVAPVAPGGEPIEVVLPPEQVMEGVVVGPDGQGVRGVRIRARPLGPAFEGLSLPARSARTREDGTFRLGGVGRGPHALHVDVPRRMARHDPVLIADEWDLFDGFRILLHEAVAPRIVVRGPGGKPIADVELRIEPGAEDLETFDDNVVLEGFYLGPGDVSEQTDAEGRAGFMRLDPEKGYVLWVHPPPARKDLAPIYRPAWRPKAEEEIRLRPWATLSGIVQDDSGRPVEGAVVWCRQPGTDEFTERGRSASDGSFTIQELRHGAVALVANDGDYPELFVGHQAHTTTDAPSIVLVLTR